MRNQSSVEKILIIGGGPAGLTAAIYAARAGLAPLVIEGPAPGGQVMLTTTVENYPGFPKGVMGPKLVADMRQQAQKFGARFTGGTVEKVDFSASPFKVFTADKRFNALAVIVATGASPRFLGLAAEKRLIGRGVSTCATCDGFFYKNKTVAVVGGGDSAITESLDLAKHAKKVFVIHRRDRFRASRVMQKRLFAEPKIAVIWNKQVVDVLGKEKVEGLVLEDTTDKKRSRLKVWAMFLAIGRIPNSRFAKSQLDLNKRGYIKAKGLVFTSKKGVFTAGDVADPVYKQLATSVGGGCMAAIRAEEYLEKLKSKSDNLKAKT